MNGAGITRMESIRYVGHFATCAESFSTVLEFVKVLQLDFLSAEPNSTLSDDVREKLFPSLSNTISHLLTLCADKMKLVGFVLAPQQEYRGVQKLVSTALYTTSHRQIVEELPLEMYQAWFSSRKDTFASLSLNSSVRHVTFQRPPLDKVFPVALAMRTLRPIFHNYQCDCGEFVDVCGLHVLKCGRVSPKPFVSLHNKVRDATVKALQDYARKNAPSALSIFSEVHRFHLCEVDRYYHSAAGCAKHRADAIVVEDSLPFQPRFLDFVQAQVEDFDESKIMRHVENAYFRKITALTRDHIGIPRASIVPIAFSSNCVFHPASLLFIDFFLCRASRVPVCEPPAVEKLKIVQAMSSAIVDQSAAILTVHLTKFIHSLHSAAFPLGLPLVQRLQGVPLGSANPFFSAAQAVGDFQGAAGLIPNFFAHSSTPLSSSVSVATSSSDAAVRPLVPAILVRSSDRIRAQGPRSSYGSAVDGGGC